VGPRSARGKQVRSTVMPSADNLRRVRASGPPPSSTPCRMIRTCWP